MNLKQNIETMKTSWTVNHKHVIITAVLVTVIAVQNFGHKLPTVSLTSVTDATAVKSTMVDCDYKCLTTIWVEHRADEIVLENAAETRKKARIQALIEANQLITQI